MISTANQIDWKCHNLVFKIPRTQWKLKIEKERQNLNTLLGILSKYRTLTIYSSHLNLIVIFLLFALFFIFFQQTFWIRLMRKKSLSQGLIGHISWGRISLIERNLHACYTGAAAFWKQITKAASILLPQWFATSHAQRGEVHIWYSIPHCKESIF